MKKSNLATLLLTTITTFFLMTGLSFSQDTTDDDWVTSGGNTYVTSGDVGIGTTTPGAKLDVTGAIRITGAGVSTGFTHDHTNSWIGLLGDNERYDYGGSFLAYTGASGGYASIRYGDARVAEPTGTFSLIRYNLGGSSIVLSTDTDGNVGIGTSSPAVKLHSYGTVAGDFNGLMLSNSNGAAGNAAVMNFATYSPNPNAATAQIKAINEAGDAATALAFYTHTGGALPEVMRIDSSGNVGIGTTNPTNKLDVNGTIRAKEVKVETGWSDFVFEENYNLPSLTQIESFIKENKHLPDIPSARQVEKEGLSVSDMLAKQMQKIEELTLYVIEQNKQLSDLKKENEAIKKELAEMKK